MVSVTTATAPARDESICGLARYRLEVMVDEGRRTRR
jgi:hypothetical protein